MYCVSVLFVDSVYLGEGWFGVVYAIYTCFIFIVMSMKVRRVVFLGMLMLSSQGHMESQNRSTSHSSLRIGLGDHYRYEPTYNTYTYKDWYILIAQISFSQDMHKIVCVLASILDN